MDKLKKLLADKIVNCETQEESDLYLKIFDVHMAVYDWNSSINVYNWNAYKRKTCYSIKNNDPMYADIDYFKSKYPEEKIYKFSEVIKKQGS